MLPYSVMPKPHLTCPFILWYMALFAYTGHSAVISVGDMEPQSDVTIKVPVIAKVHGSAETFGNGVHSYEVSRRQARKLTR